MGTYKEKRRGGTYWHWLFVSYKGGSSPPSVTIHLYSGNLQGREGICREREWYR